MRVRCCIAEQRQAHCNADDEKKGPTESSDCHGLKTPGCQILLRSDVLGRLTGTLVALATCRPNEGLYYTAGDGQDQSPLCAGAGSAAAAEPARVITAVYEDEDRGYPPYHPVMLTKVLV